MARSTGFDKTWNRIVNEENCNLPYPIHPILRNCGKDTVDIIFMITYLVTVTLMTLMMYAVIMYNYLQLNEDTAESSSKDDSKHDHDSFRLVWQQFGLDGTRYILHDNLSGFLDRALRIPEQNGFKILFLDIPMRKGSLLICKDVLEAATKNIKARKINDTDGDKHDTRLDRIEDVISSMIKRQHEEYYARLIQRVWQKRQQQKDVHHDQTEEESETEDWTLLG